MFTEEQATKICHDFADKHGVFFDQLGEIGFGRECVGFLRGSNYIDFNPIIMNASGDREVLRKYYDERLGPPDSVVDAYHKHDCLAVLGRGKEAIMQLALWVEHLEELRVEIVEYSTGATGLQALFTSVTGNCVVIKTKNK